MKHGILARNHLDENENPAGGDVVGRGITIVWQNGPLARGLVRAEPNGAFVEDVIEAARQRLEFYQGSRFACGENARALSALDDAMAALDMRTARREAAGIEGTHIEDQGHEGTTGDCVQENVEERLREEVEDLQHRLGEALGREARLREYREAYRRERDHLARVNSMLRQRLEATEDPFSG